MPLCSHYWIPTQSSYNNKMGSRLLSSLHNLFLLGKEIVACLSCYNCAQESCWSVKKSRSIFRNLWKLFWNLPISWGNSVYLWFSSMWPFGCSAGRFMAPISQNGPFWAQKCCFCARNPFFWGHPPNFLIPSWLGTKNTRFLMMLMMIIIINIINKEWRGSGNSDGKWGRGAPAAAGSHQT